MTTRAGTPRTPPLRPAELREGDVLALVDNLFLSGAEFPGGLVVRGAERVGPNTVRVTGKNGKSVLLGRDAPVRATRPDRIARDAKPVQGIA